MIPRASVVIPTFRRPEPLDRCLAALAAQEIGCEPFEVIVADDAACDVTRHQVEGWDERMGQRSPRFRYLPVRRTCGPAAARNAGWRAALGDVIAFTDDDCQPAPGWLAAGLRAIEDGAGAAAGRIVVPLGPSPTDYERDAAGLTVAEFATANCFVRRSVLDAVGGFDERYTAAWREDSDLHFTLLEAGYDVRSLPEAIVVHPVRPACWGVSLRQQRKGQFNALLRKKHPRLYRERIRRRPPWGYYAAVAGFTLAGVGVAARRGPLALAGTAAWLTSTGCFCARRLRGTSHAPGLVVEMVVTSVAIPFLALFWRLRGAVRFRSPFA